MTKAQLPKRRNYTTNNSDYYSLKIMLDPEVIF